MSCREFAAALAQDQLALPGEAGGLRQGSQLSVVVHGACRKQRRECARLLREAAARAFSGAIPKLPAELRVVLRMDAHLGGFAAKFVSGAAGVMETYLKLQVIEERAVRQFPQIACALKVVDAEAAQMVEGILRDEARHVRYAQAIARAYEPDDAAREQATVRFRAAEVRAFAEHQRLLLRFVVQQDLLGVRGPERLFWRALAA
jgi:hypothetical protein